MSLIIPQKDLPVLGDVGPLGVDDLEFDLHPTLAEDFDANPKYWPIFIATVKAAVTYSFSDPRTRPNYISKQLIKDRIKLCLDALLIMRQEMNTEGGGIQFTLKRAFDILPQRLLDSIITGEKMADLIEKKDGRSSMYSKEGLIGHNETGAEFSADIEALQQTSIGAINPEIEEAYNELNKTNLIEEN